MSSGEVSLEEIFKISNMRRRNVEATITNTEFNSSDDDSTYEPSSDERMSSQETEIYEYEEEVDNEVDDTKRALYAYKFYYNYVKVRSVASFLASITLMMLSGFSIVYETMYSMYKSIKGASKEFKRTSGSIYDSMRVMIIYLFYGVVYSFAGVGVVFLVLVILYRNGYVSFSPINYLVEG